MQRLVLAEVTADEGPVVAEMGEVQPCKIAPQLERRLVVGESRLLSGVEGAKPESGPVLGQTDLSDPFAPVALPHSSVELHGLRRRGGLLHRNGLWGQEVMHLRGLGPMSCRPVLMERPGDHMMLILVLEADLGLDIMDLGGSQLI